MIINHPLPAYHTIDKHILIAHYKWNYKSVCTLTTTPSDWVGELCIASLVSIWCTHYCNNPPHQSILWYYWHVTWQHCESWSIVILIHQTYYKLQWKWRNYGWKMHRICYVHACMEVYPYIIVCMCICSSHSVPKYWCWIWGYTITYIPESVWRGWVSPCPVLLPEHGLTVWSQNQVQQGSEQ